MLHPAAWQCQARSCISEYRLSSLVYPVKETSHAVPRMSYLVFSGQSLPGAETETIGPELR